METNATVRYYLEETVWIGSAVGHNPGCSMHMATVKAVAFSKVL